jgi:hypothetical protein
MATLTLSPGLDQEDAFPVIEHVVAAGPHSGPGTLHIVQLGQRLRTMAAHDREVREEMVFAAKPGSRSTSVRRVHIVFLNEDGTSLPAPELIDEQATIRLFYPIDAVERIKAMVLRRGVRLCYFWRSADASRVRAWLFSPR